MVQLTVASLGPFRQTVITVRNVKCDEMRLLIITSNILAHTKHKSTVANYGETGFGNCGYGWQTWETRVLQLI